MWVTLLYALILIFTPYHCDAAFAIQRQSTTTLSTAPKNPAAKPQKLSTIPKNNKQIIHKTSAVQAKKRNISNSIKPATKKNNAITATSNKHPLSSNDIISVKNRNANNKQVLAKSSRKHVHKKEVSANINYATHNFTVSDKYAGMVVHYDTGRILYEKNSHAPRYPASLVKIMTLYILFDEIAAGNISLNQKIFISVNAASQPKSNLSLKAGTYVSVKEAILALIVKSANDIAYAVAENIGGSEEKFVYMMNHKAATLGMHNTFFYNASGLPHKKQVTTAYDMALLSLSLRKNHAKFYHLFSRTSFKFGTQIIKGHNRVLQNYKWADGLKTGYIRDSGFNIVTTAKKAEAKLIAVVMGGDTASMRDKHTIELLDSAYRNFHQSTKNRLQSLNIVHSQTIHDLSQEIKTPFDVLAQNTIH